MDAKMGTRERRQAESGAARRRSALQMGDAVCHKEDMVVAWLDIQSIGTRDA